MIKKIGDHIEYYFDYGVDTVNRELYLGSHGDDGTGNENGVDYLMTSRFIKGLSLLIKHPGAIKVIMNNPGGEWQHGIAIYDAIKGCVNHTVTIEVFGHAMSMGGVILQAADVRKISKHSKFMMHYGYMGLGMTHAKIFEKWSEESRKINLEMENILLERIREKHPKFALSRLRRMLDYDTILTAEETVELGLADEII